MRTNQELQTTLNKYRIKNLQNSGKEWSSADLKKLEN